MQRIVLATDLSDTLDAMLETAVKLAGPRESQVYIVYCRSPHDDYVREADNDEQVREYRENADSARDYLRERGVQVPHCQQLCTEDVVRSILVQLERFDADVLMIGSRPHGKVRQYFGDRIRDRLLQKAPCPVLVVRAD